MLRPLETFYTFLGGPRTFWGGGGKTVINNYIPMFDNGHHCHCNNTLYKMLVWSLFNQGLKSLDTPEPEQNYNPSTYNMYPGLDLSTTYNPYTSQLCDTDELTGCRELYGDKFKFQKIGEKYYAVSSDSKTQLSADEPEELMEQIKGHQASKKTKE